MADKKWHNVDWTEEIAIAALGIVAVASVITTGISGNEIPLVISSGLIGYLRGMKKDKSDGSS